MTRCPPSALPVGPGGALGGRRLMYVLRMFWPLIGAFIAFVLFAIVMGMVMDTSGRDSDQKPH